MKKYLSLKTFFYTPTLSKLIFVLFCLALKFLPSDANCKLLNPSPREEKLLEKLQPLNGILLEAQDLVSPNNFSYKIKICDKMEGRADGVGAVQLTPNGSFILGSYDKAEVIGGKNWMLLLYYGGEKYNSHCNHTEREMHLMIVCDPTTLAGNLRIIEERNSSPIRCFFLFEVGSSVLCTQIPIINKGYSSGSVFCILFFTSVILYIILGFLYKRLIVGAKGLEQIPNYSFWKEFGNLSADGCDYVCRCGTRNESHAYRGIDDDLATEDERDDSILNM